MTPAVGAPGAMLVVISGPSGVGKDAILEVLQGLPGHADHHYVVTCTTRARRPGEVDGQSYHFMAPEQFQALRAAVACSRRTRSMATGTGPPASRSRRRSGPAATRSSRSTSRALMSSVRGFPTRS